MSDPDKTIEKLLTIEKAINEMVDLRQRIIELKESETERQKAIAGLRTVEEKYRTLVENIPQKLFVKDRNSVYLFCNKSYAQDLKIKPEEISGKSDYEFFPKDLADQYISDDDRIMQTGKLENIEERYVHDGQGYIVHTIKVPIKDERGNIRGILGISWDVTEQRRNEEEMRKYRVHLEELVSSRTAELETVNRHLQREINERTRLEGQLRQTEESLRAFEGRYRAFIENAHEAIVVVQEGRLKFCNPQIFRISGYGQNELTSRPLEELVYPEDREIVDLHLRRLERGEAPHFYSFRMMHKSGQIRWLENRGTCLQWEGKPAVLNFITDITERKQAEEELRNSLEPFRALVSAMEKILTTLYRE